MFIYNRKLGFTTYGCKDHGAKAAMPIPFIQSVMERAFPRNHPFEYQFFWDKHFFDLGNAAN